MSAGKRPHKARFEFVATQVAPTRHALTIEAIQPEPLLISGYRITLECGHSSEYVPHFTYSLKDWYRCADCGRDRARILPEFAGFDFSDAALAKVQP